MLVLYLWLLGGLMGIWRKTGAAQAFAEFMTKHFVRGPRSAKLVAWSLGVLFFQGGTVSTVLVGTTVRPLADKEKVSHEEMSYIVDSTLAYCLSVGLQRLACLCSSTDFCARRSRAGHRGRPAQVFLSKHSIQFLRHFGRVGYFFVEYGDHPGFPAKAFAKPVKGQNHRCIGWPQRPPLARCPFKQHSARRLQTPCCRIYRAFGGVDWYCGRHFCHLGLTQRQLGVCHGITAWLRALPHSKHEPQPIARRH